MNNSEQSTGRRISIRKNVSMTAHGTAALNAGLWGWYFAYYFTFAEKGSQGF